MNLKIENWKLLVLSAFYLVFSIISYSVPAVEFLNFFKIAGIAITIVGALQVLIYFLKKDYMKPHEFNFSMGVLLMFAGLIIAIKSEIIVDNYRMVIGGLVVLDSILRMQYSMNLLRVQDKQWKIHTVLAVLPALMGVALVLVSMGEIEANYFSFLLILDAIANIYTVLYYKRIVKQFDAQSIDQSQHGTNTVKEEIVDVVVESEE